jgi:hypothetical protein
MSGSSAQDVRLFVGKLRLPDIDSLIGISGLDPTCRVCRASIRVETCHKSEKVAARHQAAQIIQTMRVE